MAPPELNNREHAILRAIRDGRGELSGHRCSELMVDGCWCDPAATWHLLFEGLIAPVSPAPPGGRVAATLTSLGEFLVGEGPLVDKQPDKGQ
jgi:hypothetical protein